MEVIKYSEKVLIWLHRNNNSMKWLSDKLDQTRQSISQKVRDNNFSTFDKSQIAGLGFKS